MCTFLANIKVTGIEHDAMTDLREQEFYVMKQYEASGNLLAFYVRKDLSGAFLVFSADDLAHFNVLMNGLPMFPYMTVEAVELI
ncbi:MAG: muconolactone Delta-isomerase family protein [Bacteroidota bacterium]